MSEEPSSRFCDFCGGPHPCTAFHAHSFALAGYTSIGAWVACEACSFLIVADDWEGLLDRAVAICPSAADAPLEVRRQGLAWSHSLFRQHRITGEEPQA